MRMLTAFLAIAITIPLASCSSVQTKTTPTTQTVGSFRFSEPFAISISTPTPQLERFLREYVATEFGRTLKITESNDGKGVIEVTYASSGQGNAFADWQNSTMLVVIRTAGRERLWSGEYNYKGGMEMSGFVVTTREEAAKLVTMRLAKKFESDIRR